MEGRGHITKDSFTMIWGGKRPGRGGPVADAGTGEGRGGIDGPRRLDSLRSTGMGERRATRADVANLTALRDWSIHHPFALHVET